MSDDLRLVTERLRQDRTARQTAADTLSAQQRTGASRAVGIFIAGDRVFDSISGTDGAVISATDVGSAAIGTVGVQLAGGAFVTRRPRELVLRPERPIARGEGR